MLKVKSLVLALLLVFAGSALSQNNIAARNAANSTTNACAPIPQFYWEIGDKNMVRVSGKKGTDFGRDTQVSIASATKLMYAAYVVQGTKDFPKEYYQYLNFTSGYTNFRGFCEQDDTIDSCLVSNGGYTLNPDTVGMYSYGGGHMQKLASLTGLGNDNNTTLAAKFNSALGTDIRFTQPLPSGGAVTNAKDYAGFLQKILQNRLFISSYLGQKAVCTDPLTCVTAINSPASPRTFSYSLGHWVETSVDGAFSSAGAAGFYPWINASKTHYGIVARESFGGGSGGESSDCGAAIRKAYFGQ
jgi:hypothetical protein